MIIKDHRAAHDKLKHKIEKVKAEYGLTDAEVAYFLFLEGTAYYFEDISNRGNRKETEWKT